MDKVLKIYDGSGANYVGDGSLDYSIKNDLLNYKFIDENTYIIDKFDCVLNGKGKYDISLWDVWRLFNLDGTLAGSGRITNSPEATFEDNIRIMGAGWVDIFKDRAVDLTMTKGDGGDDVIDDILTNYYSEYTFSSVTSATTNTFNEKSFKGLYAYDVVKWCCDNCYGGNNKNFQIRVYEAIGALGTLQLKYREQDSSSSGVTIEPRHIKPDTFDIGVHNPWNYKKVIVYGDFVEVNKCPIDGDWWTEETGLTDYWSSDESDTVTRTTTGETVGSACVQCENDDDNDDIALILDFNSTDAFDADYTPTDFFTSGVGYQLDFTKNQYLGFWLTAGKDAGDDPVPGTNTLFLFVTKTDSGESYTSGTTVSQLNYRTGSWLWFEYLLKELPYDATNPAGLRHLEHGEFVHKLEFGSLGNADWMDDQWIKVDGLHFFDKSKGRVEGSYTGSITGPPREKIMYEDNIKSVWLCNDIAEYFQTAQYNQYIGSIDLLQQINDLVAGKTVNIRNPQKGVSLDDIPIQRVIWTPYNQHVEVGRMKTAEEIISEGKSELRMKI